MDGNDGRALESISPAAAEATAASGAETSNVPIVTDAGEEDSVGNAEHGGDLLQTSICAGEGAADSRHTDEGDKGLVHAMFVLGDAEEQTLQSEEGRRRPRHHSAKSATPRSRYCRC